MEIPGRKKYIKSVKERGWHVAVILPIHFPRELLEAFDVLPVEMWGPPGLEYNLSSKHVQPYICPIVKNTVEFYLKGGMDGLVDIAVFPHTCDSIQGLVTVFTDMIGWDIPTTVFYYPRTTSSEEIRQFVLSEVKRLIAFLEYVTGKKYNDERLKEVLRKYQKNATLKKRLLTLKASKGIEGSEFWRVIRAGEYLLVEDHNLLLEKFIEELSSRAESEERKVVFISGYVPEPMEIYDVIAESGFSVIYDDYAAIGRRIVDRFHFNENMSGMDNMVNKIISYNPCPTLTKDVNVRIEYLDSKFKESGAKGLILHLVKFCEPELFDVPYIEEHFRSKGIPVLFIETNLEKEFLPRDAGRIEAFLEALS